MNIEEIKNIVKMMQEYQLTEFNIEAENCNLRIKRAGTASIPAQVMLAHPAAMAPVASAPATGTPPAEKAAPAEAPADAPEVTLDSPLVGTFYRAPAPDARNFVEVGDRVTEGTVIGVIEAMKVMNEIKAEKAGVVKAILVENGQPVEFGQKLIVLG